SVRVYPWPDAEPAFMAVVPAPKTVSGVTDVDVRTQVLRLTAGSPAFKSLAQGHLKAVGAPEEDLGEATLDLGHAGAPLDLPAPLHVQQGRYVLFVSLPEGDGWESDEFTLVDQPVTIAVGEPGSGHTR